jgi:hypothetical protein
LADQVKKTREVYENAYLHIDEVLLFTMFIGFMNYKTRPRVIVPDFLRPFAFSCTLHLLHNQIQPATREPSPTYRTMVPSRISRHRSVNNMARATRASNAPTIEIRAAKLAKVATPPRDMQLPIIQQTVALLKERREKAI